MSFCPSKDIHSVYLDNELPEVYKAEYEAHIKECPKCQQELAKIRKLHELFNSDSAAITPDSHYLDQSFERLQMKMKFSENVNRKASSDNNFNFRNIGYAGVAAAAAAVFALIIPVRINSAKTPAAAPASATVASSVPITASNVSFDSGKSTVISGNIGSAVLHSGRPVLVGNNDVELLRPELETISIKITLPGIDDVPVTTEVQLPMGVISGRY